MRLRLSPQSNAVVLELLEDALVRFNEAAAFTAEQLAVQRSEHGPVRRFNEAAAFTAEQHQVPAV